MTEKKSKKTVISSSAELNPVTNEIRYNIQYNDGTSESGKLKPYTSAKILAGGLVATSSSLSDKLIKKTQEEDKEDK